ncbi:TackOD1 domain-containing metal-binding protein [Shewanella seohaensis]|uniref:Thaumarchaeal output domain-containing protein n=1 Tax=Shewanella seohaensis TaxID=755175 RepID=A0ABV4VTM0_9GAMM
MATIYSTNVAGNCSLDDFVWIGAYNSISWHPQFEVFNSVEALLDLKRSPDCIVLSLQAEEQDKCLRALRKNDATFLSDILVCHESALSPYLANGLWDAEYDEGYQLYQLKKQQIKLDYHDDPRYKLLTYLWCHQDAILEPHSVPEKSYLYDYPLLRCFGINPEESFSWLGELQKAQLIEKAELSNRLRFCPGCHSGHLNYIDVCPQCHSIDTEQQSSLHCFNCGHVGAQASFRKLNTLCCPNCLQNLRHIGVDYDRPIENQHCNSCQTLFVDAVVEAKCLHCQLSSKLDDLHVRNVYSFKLAIPGRTLVRQGRSQSWFALEPGEQMTSAQFYWLLDWQNKLAKRHHQTHSILSIQMLNVDEFLATEGEAKGFAQLDALQERLRSVIRVTDACSNYTRDGLLMLLPMTEMGQLKSIYNKLFDLKELQSASKIELSVKALTLPADIGENVGEWLTDQLLKAKPI